MVRLLQGVRELEASPQLPSLSSSHHTQDISVVDDVAGVLVGILSSADARDAVNGRVMNITAETSTLTSDLFAWVGSYVRTTHGATLKQLSHEQWLVSLRESAANPLYMFLDMLAHGVPTSGTAGRDRAFAAEIIHRVLGRDFQPINEKMVHRALSWLDACRRHGKLGRLQDVSPVAGC